MFGFIPTGSRPLPGLTVYFYWSPPPTFNSGRVLSPLFGQALKRENGNWVYLDVPGDELSFTGNSNTLSSFTIGAYFYNPDCVDQQHAIAVLVDHSYGNQTWSSNYNNWRLCVRNTNCVTMDMAQTNGAQTSYNGNGLELQ